MSRLRSLLDPGDWRAVRPCLDPGEPTLRIQHRGDSRAAKLRAGVGLAVLAAAGAAGYLARGDALAVMVACGFGFFALLNLVFALAGAGFQMDVSVRPDEVVYSSRSLGRTTQWREPLSSYRGVLLREEQSRQQSVSTIDSTVTHHVVELAHDDPSKTIPLYVAEGGRPARERQQAFAERFRLPALEADGREEAAPARLASTAARDPGPPPPGIEVRMADGTTRVVIGAGAGAKWLTALVWGSLPLVFGAMVYLIDPVLAYFAAAAAALLVLVLFGASRLMRGKQTSEGPAVCLNEERIWIEWPEMARPRWMETARAVFAEAIAPDAPTESLPLESMPRRVVEQVRVDDYTSVDASSERTLHARLLIEANAGRLEYIGTQFDRKKLEWVRDYLRFRLASGD